MISEGVLGVAKEEQFKVLLRTEGRIYIASSFLQEIAAWRQQRPVPLRKA